jgi:nucleotide-binding universal stress UspA family protein
MTAMSTVLLTTDGSDLATAAMARGVALLGRDHRFISLAVVPPAFIPAAAVSPMDSHPTVIDAELEQQIEDEERDDLNADLVKLDEVLEVTAEHIVETGDPGATICEVAANVDADIVVVGSHGHGLLARVLMGSVSNHVLHHAPCPVLVIRLQEASES